MKNVIVDRKYTGYNQEYLSFETGSTPDIFSDLKNNSFDNFSGYQSAIASLYDILLLGKPMPNVMIMNHIGHYANILAATFHVYNLDIFSEDAAQLVFVIDHIDRYGDLGFLTANHKIDALLKSVFYHINVKDSDPEEIWGTALKVGIDLFHDYLKNRIQTFDGEILYTKDSFVVAKIEGLTNIDGLYRLGYTWGAAYTHNSGEIVLFNRSVLTGAPMDEFSASLGGFHIKLGNMYLNKRYENYQDIIKIYSKLVVE